MRWRRPPLAAAYGWIDVGEIMRPHENVCGYATTWVRAKAGTRAPRKISLWMGAAGAFRVYWNGEPVLEDNGYRELDVDRFAAVVTLAPGDNRITVKVCGADEAPKFALRAGDEKGEPDLGIDVKADPAQGAPIKGKPSDKLSTTLAGPMQAFERLVSGAKPPPAALEAFARYLASTGGDSKPEHRARDLSQRASEAEPTVKRLLLASQLAEDRNQTREWVDKAAAIASPKDLDVLLA